MTSLYHGWYTKHFKQAFDNKTNGGQPYWWDWWLCCIAVRAVVRCTPNQSRQWSLCPSISKHALRWSVRCKCSCGFPDESIHHLSGDGNYEATTNQQWRLQLLQLWRISTPRRVIWVHGKYRTSKQWVMSSISLTRDLVKATIHHTINAYQRTPLWMRRSGIHLQSRCDAQPTLVSLVSLQAIPDDHHMVCG